MKRRQLITQPHPRRRPFWWVIALMAGLAIMLLGGWVKIRWQTVKVNERWQGEAPFRWLVIDETDDQPLLIGEYFPAGQTVVAIRVPKDLVVEAGSNLGQYRLGTLPLLDKQEGYDNSLIMATVMQQFGVSIRTVINIDTNGNQHDGLEVLYRSTNDLLKQSLMGKGLPLPDSVRLWRGIRQVDPGKRIDLVVPLERVTQAYSDVDGLSLRRLEPSLWDFWWDNEHSRFVVTREPVTVAVENTTGIDGLANNIGRILERDGFEVIAVIDGRQALPRTLVLVQQQELLDQALVADIRWLFPEADWRVGLTEERRSQVVVRLGQTGFFGQKNF